MDDTLSTLKALNAMLAQCTYTKGAAALTGIDRGVLGRYAALGKATPLRLPCGNLLWRPCDLQAAKVAHEEGMAAKKKAAERAIAKAQRKLAMLGAKLSA